VPVDSLKASWLVYGHGFVQGTSGPSSSATSTSRRRFCSCSSPFDHGLDGDRHQARKSWPDPLLPGRGGSAAVPSCARSFAAWRPMPE
jgi:hypothetical protein